MMCCYSAAHRLPKISGGGGVYGGGGLRISPAIIAMFRGGLWLVSPMVERLTNPEDSADCRRTTNHSNETHEPR